jgi:hypothetical protein
MDNGAHADFAFRLLGYNLDKGKSYFWPTRRGKQMDLLVNVDVNDLDKAVRFYSAAFGLRIGRRFGTFGVEMLGSSAPIYR